MATCTFSIRPNKNKNLSTINLSFSWSSDKPFRKSLGIKIPTSDWDSKKQLIKHTDRTYKYVNQKNKMLLDLREHFLAEFNLEKSFDIYKSEDAFNKFFKEPGVEVETQLNFLQFIDSFIKDAPNRINPKTKRPVSKRSIQEYNRVRKIIVGYEKNNKVRLRITDINLDFHYKLIKHLEIEENLTNKNTVGGIIKTIKMFVGSANKKGFAINKEALSSEFVVTSEESISIALNEKEIDLLFKHDFSKNKRYENVRDWCVVGCWIGLRVSDWNRIENIDKDFITIKPLKTMYTSGVEVVIPLHPQVKKIIKKRGFPKKMSSVEYNRIIKKVCEDVGIDVLCKGSVMVKDEKKKIYRKKLGIYPKYKLISSHTCRRSFATNLYKSDFPTLSIMQITGHTTEKSFLKYIKVTPREHANKLKLHWEKAYK